MGAFLVILSAFGFSTLGIFGKFAYAQGFTRDQMLFLRFALSLPFLALVLGLNRAWPRHLPSYLRAVLLGAIGIGIEATLFFLSIEHMGASLTGVFLYLYPAFVALLSHFFFHEKLTSRKWICVAASLVGSVLTVAPFGDFSGSGTAISAMGLLWGTLTGLWYGVYLLAGDRLIQNQNPLTVSSGIVLGAAFTFGVLVLISGQGLVPSLPADTSGFSLSFSWNLWWPIMGLALFASVLPFTTLYAGMKRTGAVMASVLSTTELVFTIILAALFLDEKLTLIQWLGALLVLASAFLMKRV